MTDAEPVTDPDPMLEDPMLADPMLAPSPPEESLAVAVQILPIAVAGSAMRPGFHAGRLDLARSSPGMPDTIPTFLALFLILLTFFIGLTADASFNVSRVGAVVESVQASFAARGAAGSPVRASGELGGLVEFGDREARPADPMFVDAFRAVFAPLVQEGAVIKASADGRVFVELPQAVVFIPGTGAVRRERKALFGELSSLLTGKDVPDDRRMAVTVLDGEEVLAVTRAATMGRWLASDPQVARKVSAGTMPADELGVRFEIYRAGGTS